MEPSETHSESTGGPPNSLMQQNVEKGASTPEKSKLSAKDPSTSPLQSLTAERIQQSKGGRARGRARGRAGKGFRRSIDEIKPGGLASHNKTPLGSGSSRPSGVGVLAEYVELKKPEATAPMPPASYSSPPTLLSFGDAQYKMTASKTKIPEQCSWVPSLQQQLPFGQYSVAQAEPSTMSATGESMNVTHPTASFSLLPSFNSASIGTSTTGPATSYSASDTVSYSEMPPLSKPSGQAYQLEGQLQLEESVQASKPPQTSTVSYSPATVSNTVKVMPASIKGTIVQNVCSASPAEIGATTLLVTTSTPAVSFSEMPPVSSRQSVGDMSGNHSLQNLSCTRLPEVSYQQQVTNNGALGKDNTVSFSEMPPVSSRQSVGDMSGNHSLQNLSCTRLPEVSYQQQVTNNGALGKDNTEKPGSTAPTTRYMLFSSLSSKISKGDLEIYCAALGDNAEVESIDLLGNGKARALVSGLTSEEMSRIKTKNHKLRGDVFSVEFDNSSPVFTQDDGTDKNASGTEQCTIEVKSIPRVIAVEVLEMYFENSRSGGSEDCVKEIKIIDSETAHVIFHTPEAAACVLAKESHSLLKQPLNLQYVKKTRPSKEQREYERTKLFLQKIPADLDDEFFQLYLSTRLKIEVEDDFKVERVGDVAVITFTREYPITELEKMISSIQEKPLRKAKVEAELYKVCSSIRISNVTRSDHYNDDFLSLYFESKNSGEGVKVVQSVELLGNGEAVISFEDPKDAQEVLKHSHSSSLGNGVLIELNDPLCIAKQSHATAVLLARPAISSIPNTSKPTSIPKNTNSLKINVKPLLALSISKNTRDLNHRLDTLQVQLEIEKETGIITVTSTKKTPAHWQKNCKTQIESYIKETFSEEQNQSIPKDAFTDILGQLSNLQNEAPSFVYNFGENNAKLSIAGEKLIVDHAKEIIKDISDRYTITQIDISLSPQEFTFLVTFKLPEIKKRFSSIAIDPQESHNALSVRGTVKDIHELRQVVNELKVHLDVPIVVDQRINAFLKSTLGYQRLLSFVRTQSYPLVVHCGNSKLSFLCELSGKKSADDAIKKLKQTVTTHKNPLSKSFVLLQSQLEDYPPLCQELENQNKVVISTLNNELIVVGFQENVQQCSKHLLQYIKEKCTDEVVFTIEAGVWRLFQTHMRAEWLSITKKCNQLEVACKEPTNRDEDSCTLIFKGDKLHVKQITNDLSCVQAKVCKQNIEKNQPGTCKYFRSEKARTFLDGIEARNCVVIEVTEADETVLVGDNSSAKFVKKCTALLPKGGKKVNVFVGDITEFDGTDVIVNAANEDLKHIGGVALAIAKKGGPIIQTDSDNHVRKHGKVDTGNAWLTENVGNLPCKALVHVVGPRWVDGRNKEEALLRKSCFQSLQSCHRKFRSISFPAISSGVYGFPLDKCALTMVKTFIEYDEKHSSSTIQEINLVLYKEPDSIAFVSTLQRLLPKASIQMEQARKATTTYNPQPFYGSQSNRTTPKGRKKKANASVPLHQGSAPIKLHQGGLLDVQADVYVNSANRNLDLSQGAVAQALLRAGGQTLQTECTAKAPIRTGDVVATKPGNIRCQYILHTVVPNFDQPGGKAQKVLRKVIRSCLETCSKLNVSSVAFPSIGTGNLRFPNNIAAEVMVDEIQSFFASSASSISTVHLVIFMADTYQAFQTAIQNSQTTSNPSAVHIPKSILHTRVPKRVKPRSYSQPPLKNAVVPGTDCTVSFGQLRVKIIQGDIGDQDTDTIVVPTNSTMQLTGQGVAGAILRKGGHNLQETCNTVLANFGKLTEGKVIFTPVTGDLKSKTLFHIVFESKDDKKFVKLIVACLQEAENMKYKSIALPAIGTGIHGYPAQVAALGMYKAIQQVSPILSYLKQIRIVLYSHDDCSKFIQVFQNPASFETPGFIERAINFVFPSRSEASASESPVTVTFDDINQEVVIRVYGKTNASVNAAEKGIEKLIEETFISNEVENRFIDNLSPEEVSRLQSKSKELDVYIEIDPDPLNTIKIKGDASNVHKMQCFAMELLSEVERAVKRKKDSEQVYKTIKWFRTDSNGDEEEYSQEENLEIENAYRYRSGKGDYRHTSQPDHTDFTIDFEKNEEIDHTKQDSKCSVNRVDLLKKVQEETPKEWVKMPINLSTGKEEIVHVVDLDSKSQEYQGIQQKFNASMQSVNAKQKLLHSIPSRAHLGQLQAVSLQRPSSQSHIYSSIIRIERIQNPTLYSQYIARKKKMDKLNPQGCQNERQLFHGTKPDNCPTINHGGFNRSYCGQNATVYGKGVYFARDAEYSARDTYSPPDANGYKYIYLARVLTGEFTRGAGGMLVPPVKDPSKNAHITFDSVVDNVAAPGIFVVFQDAQNYPEYLITFSI